ncbi:heme o synthase [bacterium]|nr:heme o synthase [bacterium]
MKRKENSFISLAFFLPLTVALVFLGMVIGGVNRLINAPVLLRYLHQGLVGVGMLSLLVSLILTIKDYRKYPWLVGLLGGAGVLISIQAILGMTLLGTEPALWVTGVHYVLSVLILALTAAGATHYWGISDLGESAGKLKFESKFSRSAIFAVGMVMVVLVSGVVLSSSGFGGACVGWPFCDDGLIPHTGAAWFGFFHRVVVAVMGVFLIGFNLRAWRTQRTSRLILTASNMVVTLYFAQAFIGAMKVLRGAPLDLLVLHEITAALLLAVGAVMVISVGMIKRTDQEAKADSQLIVDRKQRRKDFLALNKPIVVALLLSTTLFGMVIGAKGFPSFGVVLVTLISGALAAGGSSAVNQYLDRDLDTKMTRTANRPIPAGRLTPAEGLAFGVTSLLVSFYLMAGLVNILAALLSLAGMVYYVVLYSIILKKRSSQNIVIGGGAGAIPPLVGWAAATGSLNLTALFLFLIIFLWTPPHFWSLAMLRKKDYAEAGVPMMPVEKGEEVTKKLIFQYTVVLVGFSILMWAFQLAGWIYLAGALLLGVYLTYLAWQVWKAGRNRAYYKMYRHSNYYLFLLFLVLAVDAVII